MENFASTAIDKMTFLIARNQYKIDNPLVQVGQWPASKQELENRNKGITMIMKIIKENPNPGSGDHHARFQGLILATINNLKLKGDKSELCGILIGMAQAVKAYMDVQRELSNLQAT